MGIFTARLLNFANELRLLSFVNKNLTIKATRNPKVAIWRVPDGLAVSAMFSFGPFEFKWRSFIKSYRIVFTSCNDPERSSGPEITAIDRSGLSSYVSVGGSRVSQENVAELFPPFADADDPLIIRGPG